MDYVQIEFTDKSITCQSDSVLGPFPEEIEKSSTITVVWVVRGRRKNFFCLTGLTLQPCPLTFLHILNLLGTLKTYKNTTLTGHWCTDSGSDRSVFTGPTYLVSFLHEKQKKGPSLYFHIDTSPILLFVLIITLGGSRILYRPRKRFDYP